MITDHDYKFDPLVFAFINSENCKSYNDLKDFLLENKLPILERWAYYYWGKDNAITQDSFDEDYLPSYKASTYEREIYHWRNYYIIDLDAAYVSICKKLSDENKPNTVDAVFQIFIEEGYEYVECCMNSDREAADNDFEEYYHNNREEYEYNCENSSDGFNNTTNSVDWTNYNDDLDMDQQNPDFWNQF